MASTPRRASSPRRGSATAARWSSSSTTSPAIRSRSAASAPGARLLVHETESLDSEHPALRRYYELVAELQRHHGQALDVGATLDATFARSPWRVLDSRAVTLEIPAARMAELHLANLLTWREEEHARRAFDRAELDRLEATLARVMAGNEAAPPVRNVVRQIVGETGR